MANRKTTSQSNSDSESDKSNNVQLTELLLMEYGNRFNEIMFHSARYHKQTDFIQVFITLGVLLSPLLFSDKVAQFMNSQNWSEFTISGIYATFLIVGILIEYSLFAVVLDALFSIYLNGVRAAAIEKKLNIQIKEDLLVWESKIIPQIFGNLWIEKSWVRPNLLSGIWTLFLFILISIVFCVMCFLFLPNFFWIYAPIVVLLTFFNVYQWLLLHSLGIEYIKAKIFQISSVEDDLEYHRKLRGVKGTRGITPEFLIVVTTFLLGFYPFTVLSVRSDTFWLDSAHPFPLLVFSSIWIGDLLIIPVFNLFFYKFLVQTKDRIAELKVHVFCAAFVSLLFSCLINSYTHYSWVHDPYTGFMDLRIGVLSSAGWWHFGFSGIQMAIVFFFLFLWFILNLKNDDAIRNGLRALCSLFVFSLLLPLDVVLKHFIVLKTQSLIEAIRMDWLVVTITPVSLLILLLASSQRHRFPKQS